MRPMSQLLQFFPVTGQWSVYIETATNQRDVTGRRRGAHVKTRLTDGARAIKGS